MGRIRLPRRPDRARVQQARIAAARVQTASAQAKVEADIATVEASVPPNYADSIADLDARIAALETP